MKTTNMKTPKHDELVSAYKQLEAAQEAWESAPRGSAERKALSAKLRVSVNAYDSARTAFLTSDEPSLFNLACGGDIAEPEYWYRIEDKRLPD